MTEQELRDKIVEVLKNNTREPFFINGKSVSCYDIFAMQEAKINTIADTLIAEGLTFDGEWKHRAEVAERAARDLIAYYCSYTIQRDIDNSLCAALQQAEQELAEEGEDD